MDIETKTWWQSRTIWLQIVAIGFVLGAKFNLIPEGLTQEEVVLSIMGVVGAANVFLRFVTSAPVSISSGGQG